MNKPQLEHVSCNLCGSGETAALMQKRGYFLVRCVSCGLVYVNPRLPARALADMVYGQGYFQAEQGYGLEDHFSAAARERAVRQAQVRLKLIEKFVAPGALLDVGCAAGYFPLAARERGWSAHGVEISEHAASFARTQFGIEVFTGEFSSMAPMPEAFDLVTMFDVIEHIPDPLQGLRNAAASLKPDGFLYLATPNFDGLPARALGATWGLIEPEHHFYYFTPHTLERMLHAAGFEVARTRFPLLGLNDLLLSAGALQKAGVAVGESQKSFVRKYLRAPRAVMRGLLGAADAAVFAPLFARNRGVIIEVIAKKQGLGSRVSGLG